MSNLRSMIPALCATCSLSTGAFAQSRPNLIFILTDDQGVDAIQWPVEPVDADMVTPTLYALASQGVSFSNCRVNPNCSPTRGCLMTGRSALDTGVCGVLGRHVGDNNGTDVRIAGAKAKNTLYERGIHVPLFVMGEGVPGDPQGPIIDDRPVTHVDMFETICDIVDCGPLAASVASLRTTGRRFVLIGPGAPPRRSRTIASCAANCPCRSSLGP